MGIDPTTAFIFVPPELCRRQQRLDDALCRLGQKCDELGLPFERPFEITFSVVANVVCRLIPPEHDAVLVAAFADAIQCARAAAVLGFEANLNRSQFGQRQSEEADERQTR
jgi:hypothetical protein